MTETPSKPWWKSKTLWLAVLQIISGLVGQYSGTTDATTSAALVGSGAAFGALRTITKAGLK